MSQATMPAINSYKRFEWNGGWKDEDFYRIKLVCDRVEGRTGFWFYLTHLAVAWRDFWLWLKFKDKIKPPRPRARPELKFAKKKKKLEEVKKEVVETKEEIDDKKKKLIEAYDLGLQMQEEKMLPMNKEALDEQVDKMLKFDDKAFEAFKKTIEDAIKKKK